MMTPSWLRRHRLRLIVYSGLLIAILAFFALRTVPGRVVQYGFFARHRLQPYFAQSQVPYPPRSLTMVAFKDTKVLQLYAPDGNGSMRFIREYPILAASGKAGPKLMEGDSQVPEGIYRIVSLNPRSAFHLSLRLNYPNAFDRAMAHRDSRTQLGGDIMLHGNNCSAGCLAMGDTVAEDLFILAHDTGLSQITMVISPVDFRTRQFSLAKPACEPACNTDPLAGVIGAQN